MEDAKVSTGGSGDRLVQFHQRRLAQYAERIGVSVTEAKFLIADMNGQFSAAKVTAAIDAIVDAELHSSRQPMPDSDTE